MDGSFDTPVCVSSVKPRDRRILILASRYLGGVSAPRFADALDAMEAAVEESIPGGRIYVIGSTSGSLVVGSLVSRVGIVETDRGIVLARLSLDGRLDVLGPWR